MNLRPGERKALPLRRHLEPLRGRYGAARLRDGTAKPPLRCQCSRRILLPRVQSCAQASVIAGIPAFTYLPPMGHSKRRSGTHSAGALSEAADSPGKSRFIGAVNSAATAEQERPKKRLRPARGHGIPKELFRPKREGADTPFQGVQQQVMDALLQLSQRGFFDATKVSYSIV